HLERHWSNIRVLSGAALLSERLVLCASGIVCGICSAGNLPAAGTAGSAETRNPGLAGGRTHSGTPAGNSGTQKNRAGIAVRKGGGGGGHSRQERIPGQHEP